ncbi:NADPH:quinone oxidoreductase family protein [Shouchella lehensis]|uniref:Acryloyl-CoA reductase n=1 Tax=Shouchella lehensis TaxID=300825 RepID=A0A4Y7WKN4_9BACI|nr:acryloyl-CoA reductase [Shouchella lehensis]MBG9783452.1 quinone oxidoreductase [Shouchella lehensis]TES49155.1 acryloyl-CoA reductase [Shouchella lehensis]
MTTFKAFVVEKIDDQTELSIKELNETFLPKGDVLIKVKFSSINYKDGLATQADGKIVKEYPFIPGIDLAGEVAQSSDDRFKKGDQVIVTSYELGVSHFGGFSEYARVPADWIVPLPKGLSLKEAMIFGTAGFTAALSIKRLEENGLQPENGEILVTGATGGVGSMAVSMLKKKGYTVVASTGKADEHQYLSQLGANSIIGREDIYDGKLKALKQQKWAGAIDPVGGEPLASLLSQIKYRGSVAVSGLTAGGNVPTSVFPFILRGVSLIGIDSVYCPMNERVQIWNMLSSDLKPTNLNQMIAKEIKLDQLKETVSAILKGEIRGRVIIEM